SIQGEKFGDIEISLTRKFVNEATQQAKQQMALIAGLEVLLVALFSFLLGNYLTRQLRDIQNAAEEISGGEFGIQLEVQGQDEIGKTVTAFNKMSLQLKEYYQKIKSNETRLQTLLDTATNGILTFQPGGIILSANPAIEKIFGYNADELIGKNIELLFDDASVSEIYGVPLGSELSSRHMSGKSKNNRVFSLELSIRPIELEGKKVIVATITDLTQLEKAETHLTEAIESSTDGFVLFDSEDRLVICNQRYKEIYKKSADLLIPGNKFEDILRTGVKRGQYIDAVGNEEEWISKRLKSHYYPGRPTEQKLDDGTWIRVLETKTDSGAIVGFRVDITELKLREEALMESRSRLRATIESALDCIISVNQQGHILDFNPAAEKTFGYQKAHIVGTEMAELIIPPHLRDAHKKAMQKFNQTGKANILGQRIEIDAMRANGEIFPIELAIEAAPVHDDEVIFISYLRDISEQRKYENDLKHAKQRAEVANDAKATFLAMMSHEIRTPLNAVLGVLGLISETSLNKEQLLYVQTAKDSGEALLQIVNDVLDFSKIEAGKIHFEESDVEIKPLLGSLIELLTPQADAKGLSLQIEFDPRLPNSLICDGGRLRQILLNLLGNAVKFTDTGQVLLKSSYLSSKDNIYQICFEIHDTGIGIPKERQKEIFGEFSTVDETNSRNLGGTGLGLAITKKLLALMNGRLELESEEGKGSVFKMYLDFEKGSIDPHQEEPAPIVSQLPLLQLHVLVAEDNPTNMMITRKMLESQGHHVLSAGNGIEALKFAKDFNPDIILMDGSMPEMDGIQATQKIRKLKGDVANTPIIALTAHAMQGDKERYLAAGMDDYLQKPVMKNSLMETINKWASQKPAGKSNETQMDDTKNEPIEFDTSCLKKLAEDTSPEIVPELIDIYLTDAKKRLERINEAIVKEDLEAIELESHTLASSFASYGLNKLHHLALETEECCVKKQTTEALTLSRKLVEQTPISWALLEEYKAKLANSKQ
ncbi:MAG: PAS domain S-box protein, partial [Alphaproteobacteria bacterium]|nr:PAS domain S-box protein [Alphaproteobacteria bacterium]